MDCKIVLILLALQIIVSTEAKVILNLSVHECSSRSPSSFLCDFKNSVIQEVHLERLNNTYEMIYAQNVKKLHLNESVCTNISFYNITEIVTVGGKDEHCKDGFELLAVNSFLNQIPENVKNVTLQSSNITLLATNRSLKALSVKNSFIGVLRIFGTFENNSYVEFNESTVDKVEKLILDAGSKFLIKDSTLAEVSEDSNFIHRDCVRTLEDLSGDYKYTHLETQATPYQLGTVKGTSSFESCPSVNGTIHCDFNGSDVQTLFIISQDKVKKYIIKNIEKLYLDESICRNVDFSNVQEVVIAGKKNEQCKEGFEMTVENSFLSRIPRNVKKLTLKNCMVYELVTHRSLEELRVMQSNISMLNIAETFGNNSHVMIQGSTINEVEKLIFDDGSTFTVQDSTFKNVSEDSILIHPNVTPNLERLSGAFKSTDLLIYKKSQEPHVVISKEEIIFTIAKTVCVCVAIAIVILVLIAVVVFKVMKKCLSKKSSNKNDKGKTNHSEVTKTIGIETREVGGNTQESHEVGDEEKENGEERENKCQEEEKYGK